MLRLFAYSRGITSSRCIAQACEENIVFMALSCDTKPHFTTIADFVSTMDKEITRLFREVLLVCYDLGLTGKEMFAIDGCKLPSNASRQWSGTKADFEKKAAKLRAFKEWLKIARTMKTKELWEIAKAKLRGHYSYYGVTDNLPGIKRFGEEVKKLLFKWLNRRGKRGCLTWQKFGEMLKQFPLPEPRIKVRMFGCSVN